MLNFAPLFVWLHPRTLVLCACLVSFFFLFLLFVIIFNSVSYLLTLVVIKWVDTKSKQVFKVARKPELCLYYNTNPQKEPMCMGTLRLKFHLLSPLSKNPKEIVKAQ